MTAQQLIDLLCVPDGRKASAWTSRRDPDSQCTIHAGFAGYPFADDGYEFQARATSQTDPVLMPEHQPRGGLSVWPEVGDWPYIVYLRSPDEQAIVQYCEGDLAVHVYDTATAYHAAVQHTRTNHPCR